MRSNITTSIVVTLVLTPEEAAWLAGNMQNPLHGQTPSEESPEDAAMRRKFWEATKDLP
jgi:hypothetical protein